MSTYTFSSIVSTSEQDALKEMIFKRARERAQSLADDVQANYTDAVQADVMDLARNSFVSSKNPFSVNKVDNEVVTEKTVGFPKRHVADVKASIAAHHKVENSNIVNQELALNMVDAQKEFVKKSSFMGALDFLNSQASIALVRGKGKSFDAIA